MLATETVYALTGQAPPAQPRNLQVQGQNVTRVDVYSNGRPVTTGDLVNGQATLDLPSWVQGPATLELRGFSDKNLAVIGRVEL